MIASVLPGLLGACGTVENRFAVSDPNGDATAAQVRLCGAKDELIRSGLELSGNVPIHCEGEGEVRVYLSDGEEVSCHIGYVTPGAVQRFDFVIQGNRCHPKDAAA